MTGPVPSRFELIHGHSLISSSEQPICMLAWPPLLSRAPCATPLPAGTRREGVKRHKVGFGLCYGVPGNQGGSLWEPFWSRAPGSGSRGRRGSWRELLGPGLGRAAESHSWRIRRALVSWKSHPCPNPMKALRKCKVVFSEWTFFSDHSTLSCSRNPGSGVLCMFTSPGRYTTINRKSRSVLSS